MTIVRPLSSRCGMALVLTILVVSLLTITVFDIFHESWIQTVLASVYRDDTRALYAARSGQEAAKLILLEDARSPIRRDALTEEWAQSTIPLPIDGEYTWIEIRDESGKINLNSLTTSRGFPNDRWIKIFSRLLRRLEINEGIADSLVDWMDINSEPRPDGAEDGYYSSLKNPYRAKNAKLDSVDELLLVRGFTPKVMDKLREHVSVWGADKININTASDMVLWSLDDDMTGEMVKGILRARLVAPFTKREDVKRIPGLGEIYPTIALSIDVKSNIFSVKSSATFNETVKTIVAVYKRSSSDAKTLFYKVM
ncbi:General secretion pathway protein K [hydrothermal vent metagenome]|uniref:General secretion pathway protein K n=1 Tax=hydrothermal vent metagenome TaxID=652676 RepID=A0A3B1BX66_9ZZZZ